MEGSVYLGQRRKKGDKAEGGDRGALSIATKNGSTGRIIELLLWDWGSELFCVYKASH